MSTTKTTKLLQTIRLLAFPIALLLTMVSFVHDNALANKARSSNRKTFADTDWQGVAPTGEEFSILTPVKLILLRREADHSIKPDGEKILEQRDYTAYAGDFIFAIQSYKAAHPKKLSKDLSKVRNLSRPTENDISVDGFDGKQYKIKDRGLYTTVQYFVTTQHVYVFHVTARDENNPSVGKFLSSIKLNRSESAPHTNELIEQVNSEIDLIPPSSGSTSTQAQKQTDIAPSKDVGHRAILVWKPEANFTDAARLHQITGIVRLLVIFTSSGQVRVTKVVKGLEDGLTERAIEAAKTMRFFPAEKDGRPVSQYSVIEYGFSIY